jgi:hypothetical protein
LSEKLAGLYEEGAREIVAWHAEDPARPRINEHLDQVMDALVARYAI